MTQAQKKTNKNAAVTEVSDEETHTSKSKRQIKLLLYKYNNILN